MKLGHAAKFVNPLRFSATSSSFSSTSRFYHFTITTNYNKLRKPDSVIRRLLKVKGLQLNNVTANHLRIFRLSGSGSILGVSITSASIIAHAMDAGDALVDDPSNDSQDLSEEEENGHHLWKLARKFWLPVFFFLTVLTNLDDPFTILFIKLTLFLLSTKPNPFSVYIFVDQVFLKIFHRVTLEFSLCDKIIFLCQQSMCQETRFLKVKSLYASKVEVQDYKLLCLAAVEVRDQKFTLVGILGTWWTLPHLPSLESFSLVRNRIGSILVKTTEQGN